MDIPRQFPRRNRLGMEQQVDEQRFLFHSRRGDPTVSSLGPFTAVSQSLASSRLTSRNVLSLAQILAHEPRLSFCKRYQISYGCCRSDPNMLLGHVTTCATEVFESRSSPNARLRSFGQGGVSLVETT